MLWNSVVSTPGAKYMCIDIKNMYLATPPDRFQYMKIPIKLIPAKIRELYSLNDKIHNGYIYVQL